MNFADGSDALRRELSLNGVGGASVGVLMPRQLHVTPSEHPTKRKFLYDAQKWLPYLALVPETATERRRGGAAAAYSRTTPLNCAAQQCRRRRCKKGSELFKIITL
ncbi:uncharacterized protein LOC115564510 [Drosophila navojoa]|uniref:uncharacterized protein LOC115564510 n=1 Tax=Drosophila navojoa TaxID=7232 RepID=UPI0011BDDD7A|nr:uncharacterized protein LOC115564510 [Drosophila navojoa]